MNLTKEEPILTCIHWRKKTVKEVITLSVNARYCLQLTLAFISG